MKVLCLVLLSLTLGLSVQAQAEDKKAGAKKEEAKKGAAEKSLFERLGGTKAVTAVVDDFVGRAAANPKVNFFRDGKFKDLNVPNLKQHLVTFISQNTGGSDKYLGRDMTTAHAGMKITEAEFAAIAADLTASLDKFKVPAREKAELLAVVGSTKDAIVGK